MNSFDILSSFIQFLRFDKGLDCCSEFSGKTDIEDIVAVEHGANNSWFNVYEIKVSYSDFLNDFKHKHKYYETPWFRKFYFIVPQNLVENVNAYLEKNCEWAGLYCVSNDFSIKQIRKAKLLNYTCNYDYIIKRFFRRMSSELANMYIYNKMISCNYKEVQTELNKLTEKKMISKIIYELNLSNSSNYKLDILKMYKENELLKRVLKLTYDKVNFNFGVSRNTIIKEHKNYGFINCNFEQALDYLENDFNTRSVTGNAAKKLACEIYNSIEEREIFLNIVGRDLKVNLGVKQINKVFKNLIAKPNYMRCDTFSKKALKNIQFPAIIQLKMDGTYREVFVNDGVVTSKTRSGEDYQNPVLFEQMKNLPNGYYIGELTIEGDSRFTGNGLINSDNPPYNDIIFTMWDYLTLDDYNGITKTIYNDRFNTLKNIISNSRNLRIVESYIVDNIEDALKHVNTWMTSGLEGGVLKDLNNTFKNGTSKTQIKIKLKIDAEMRITGFTDGTIGTKRENKIGAIKFANDEGTIVGQCSGFSDEQLDFFTLNKEDLIGKIISVEFNDVTKAENSSTYALSHPRFVELRTDKDETDTLEKVLKLKEMAMTI